MFGITITRGAQDDLRRLRRYTRQQISDAIDTQLPYEPDRETPNRKRFQPNSLSEWELRIGNYRVFYDIDQTEKQVLIIAVGHKQGSRLIIRGQEYTL
jgi:mRNA-degrading endonuclease RelE of RelBE toxin-antitoxin system